MTKSKGNRRQAGLSASDICPLLASSIDELKAQLAICSARREELTRGGFDKDLANSAAALGRAITGAFGELRQQEKHLKHAIEQMAPEDMDAFIVAWLRDATVERRAEVMRQLVEVDAAEAVLS